MSGVDAILPPVFGNPVIGSFEYNAEECFTAIEMDKGSKVRRMTDESTVTIRLTWHLDTESMRLFSGWVKYTLNGGANWFIVNFLPHNVKKIRMKEEYTTTKLSDNLWQIELVVTNG